MFSTLVILTLVTASPGEPDAAKSKAAFKAGQQLYKQGRYPEAAAKFAEAEALRPHPVITYNLGRCFERMGELAKALAAYEDYLRNSPDAADHAAVSRLVGELERRMAKGQPEPAPMAAPATSASPPAEKTVAADAPVAAPSPAPTASALAAPPLVVAAPSASRPPRRWVWVAGGASVLALGAGITFGMLSSAAGNDLRAVEHTAAEADALLGRNRGFALAANVSYGVAAAALATAVFLFFFEGASR